MWGGGGISIVCIHWLKSRIDIAIVPTVLNRGRQSADDNKMEHLADVNLNKLFCPFDEIDSQDEVQAFIDGQKKVSTVRATKAHVDMLSSWLSEYKNEIRPIHTIIPDRLNAYLCEFFVKIVKKDGSDYEPSTLECIKASIERHFRDKNYPASIITHRVFFKTREALKAKKISLKKKGLGCLGSAAEKIEKEEEEKLISSGQLGDSTPKSLQFTLFYFFSKAFGLRGRQEHRLLKLGDLALRKTADDIEFIEMLERNSKTMDGSKKNDHRSVTPKLFAPSNTHCQLDPIKLFKLFLSKRPAEANLPDSPFYLTCIPEARIKNNIWYYKTPMGVNTLGSLLKTACNAAGIEGKKTNHSLRKSTVAELSNAGVPPHKIIKITGHKNTSSLQHYDNQIDTNEHREISSILCGQTNIKTSTSTSTFNSSTRPLSATSTTTSRSSTATLETTTEFPFPQLPFHFENANNDRIENDNLENTLKGATFNCNNCTFHFSLSKN